MTDATAPSEASALLASLNSQRAHLLGTMEGLSDADLRRGVLPSGWSCLGLVQHLTLDVEDFWFRCVIAGEALLELDGISTWTVADNVPAAVIFDRYREVTERANAILASTTPDAAPGKWHEGIFPPEFRYHNVRQIVLHVITETATHAGHLDAVRELIDGKYWLVLT